MHARWLLPLGFSPMLACAQKVSTPSPMPSDFSFNGSWSCVGAMAAGRVHRASFTGATILAGKWIELTEQDVEPATGYVARYLIGYDAQGGKFVEFDANNFGAATYSSDEGWQNGVLTMTSPTTYAAKAPYAANRFLYTITAQDSFTIDWQVSHTSELKWLPGDHLACKRQTS